MSIVIITGGSRGIGASAAMHCARRGMGVILTYNSNPAAAASVVAGIGTAGGNSISPGPIRTDLGGGMSQKFETLLAGQTALGRVGEPDDVGCLIVGLLSDEYRWVNAQNIEVAGGYMI